MGMYTELHFNAQIRKDTPQSVIDALKWMLGGEEPDVLPHHELFSCARAPMMFHCDSYYFDAKTCSELYFDDNAEAYYLCIRCNLKNYEGEIEKFIDWIIPYLNKQEGEFLGFSRYEETEQPTLIFMPRDNYDKEQ